MTELADELAVEDDRKKGVGDEVSSMKNLWYFHLLRWGRLVRKQAFGEN